MYSRLINILLTIVLLLAPPSFALAQNTDAARIDPHSINRNIEGNWAVTWPGSDPDYYTKAIMSFHYPRANDCVENAQGNCNFRQRISDSNLQVVGYYCCDERNPDYTDRGLQGFSFDHTAGTIEIEHPYYALEYWGGTEQAIVTSAGITGSWSGGDFSGQSVWTKLPVVISRVTASSDQTDTVKWVKPSGNENNNLVVGLEWDQTWERRGDMRGNRPDLMLALSGPNFLTRGQMYSVEFPDSVGIEVTGIWSNAGLLNVELTFWPGVLPGKHIMMIDDTPVTIELDLLGYPPAALPHRIGLVSLSGAAAKNRSIETQQAVTDAQMSVNDLNGDIAQQIATNERLLNQYIEDATPVQAEFLARIETFGDDQARIATERRLKNLQLDALAGPYHDGQSKLEEYRKNLPPLLEILRRAEIASDASRYAGFPQILSIDTDAAHIVGVQSNHDELVRIESRILEVTNNGVELYNQRRAVLSALEDAVTYANRTNNDLRNFSASSYVLQAFAQAAVQITDAAVASKGDPLAFGAIGLVQAANNVVLSKPTYYDAELGENGEITVSARTNRVRVNAAVGQSIANTLSKSGVGELSQRFSRSLAQGATADAAEDVVASRARRVLGRAISQDLERFAKFKGGNLVTSVLEGLLLDAATEAAKTKIAEEMTEGALRAYADAQMSVAGLTTLLRQIYQLEDLDAQRLQALEQRKRELYAERERLLPGQERMRPALSYQRNANFLLTSATEFRIRLSPNAPPFDLYIEGVKAEATSTFGVFRAGTNVVSAVTQTMPERLSLELRIR